MRLAVSSQQSAISKKSGIFLFCFLLTAFCLLSCSIPNLESPECSDAREAVRRFYSFHYANDIAPTADNLKLREKYVTPDLYQTLATTKQEKDYFTVSDTPPKAFRVAACKEAGSNKADLGVHLFWKTADETKSIQKEIEVEAVKQGDNWLVNKVTAK
jgi:hypothetical protein